MVIGIGTPIPDLANLPGPSRPGYPSGGGGTPFDNTYSMAFDGIDDYVDCSNSGTFSFGDGTIDSPFSVSAWVKMDDAARFRVFSKEDAGSAREWLFSTSSGRQLLLNLYSQNDSAIKIGRLTGVLTSYVGSWIHICGTYDGSSSSSGIKIYVNGVRSDTSDNNAGSYVAMQSNTGPFIIGGGFSYYANGNIDEASVFNYELSASDVTSIYNSGTPNNLDDLSTPPAAWYRMGENGIWKYPQWLLPENSNKDKLSNYSFNFDGINDYVGVSSSATLSGQAVVSISAWIKPDSVAGASTNKRIFDESTSTSGYTRFGIERDADTIQLKWRDSSDDPSGIPAGTLSTGSVLTVGVWTHILAIYNSTSNEQKIYINGSLSTSSTVSISALGTSTTFGINIGRSPNNSNYYGGNIDEVAIWHTDQSANAGSIYNSGTPTTITGAAAYWKLGEQANFTDNWIVNNSALSNYSTRSFNFDGIDDYIDVGMSSGTNDVSISCWMRSTEVVVYNDSRMPFGGRPSSGGSNYSLGRIRSQFATPTELNVALFNTFGSTVLNDGNWHNLIYTYNHTTKEVKAYVDGNTTPEATVTFPAWISNFQFRIGDDPSSSWFFNGNVDECAVWYSVLGTSDVTAIYNSGVPDNLSSLSPESWWRMGEDATFNGSTNEFTVPDQSGSNPGTSSNTMLLETLVGEAPNYTGGGLSNAMTIEDRVGNAPNSINNALSYNMDEVDREADTPPTP